MYIIHLFLQWTIMWINSLILKADMLYLKICCGEQIY